MSRRKRCSEGIDFNKFYKNLKMLSLQTSRKRLKVKCMYTNLRGIWEIQDDVHKCLPRQQHQL